MTAGEVLKWLLVGGLGASLGVVFYTGFFQLVRLIKRRHIDPAHVRQWRLGFTLFRFGVVTTEAIIMELVLHAPTIQPAPETFAYIAGVLITLAGAVLVARKLDP